MGGNQNVTARDDTTIIIDGKIFIDKLSTIIDKNRFLSIFLAGSVLGIKASAFSTKRCHIGGTWTLTSSKVVCKLKTRKEACIDDS